MEGVPSPCSDPRLRTEADIAFAHPSPRRQLHIVVVERDLRMREHHQQQLLVRVGLGDPFIQRRIARAPTE